MKKTGETTSNEEIRGLSSLTWENLYRLNLVAFLLHNSFDQCVGLRSIFDREVAFCAKLTQLLSLTQGGEKLLPNKFQELYLLFLNSIV